MHLVAGETREPQGLKSCTSDITLIRRRLLVRGRVQGVGFRPFVYRLALRQGLAGLVGNDSHGAFVEIEGPQDAVDAFIAALQRELPPPGRISDLSSDAIAPRYDRTFRIETSRRDHRQDAEIAPDLAVCAECLAELFDPANRRYRYPFINCMHCGPRYSIVRGVPYDRANTTMARFQMCPPCQEEYDNPADRRFHAQPNACPACGPRLWLVDGRGAAVEGDPVRMAAGWLGDGRILAVKGVGGFHLACRADDDLAVRRLRQRKHRDAKAFAVMVASLEVARGLAFLDAAACEVLCGPVRPIVLAPKRDAGLISGAVAPGSDYYGLMLPYAPLHHLLFAEGLGPLVMTSANPTEEPLCRDNDEALRRLATIADGFLMHDRDIERRVDDSVVLACGAVMVPTTEAGGEVSPASSTHSVPFSTGQPGAVGRLLPLRRARGYVPAPIQVATASIQPVLAVGGELKSTICLLADRQAVVSEHLGELSNAVTYRHFVETIGRFKELLRAEPRVVACDMHPDYAATRYARQSGLRKLEVQHHHAHIVSGMADNGLTGRVLGVACDGTGYGTDGAIWGCEVLVCDEADFVRGAHLDYFPLLGGDDAALSTWRPAAALLHQVFGRDWRTTARDRLGKIDQESTAIMHVLLDGDARIPMTSSLGRLFDAVAFLLGVCDRNRHEAEAAMTLEALARRSGSEQPLPFEILEASDGIQLMLRMSVRPLVREIVRQMESGASRERLARGFHESVAAMLVEAVRRLADRTGLDRVVLSGGCFANRLLLGAVTARLQKIGLAVFAHEQVPTGDGGVALGQAVVAAERLRRKC